MRRGWSFRVIQLLLCCRHWIDYTTRSGTAQRTAMMYRLWYIQPSSRSNAQFGIQHVSRSMQYAIWFVRKVGRIWRIPLKAVATKYPRCLQRTLNHADDGARSTLPRQRLCFAVETLSLLALLCSSTTPHLHSRLHWLSTRPLIESPALMHDLSAVLYICQD